MIEKYKLSIKQLQKLISGSLICLAGTLASMGSMAQDGIIDTYPDAIKCTHAGSSDLIFRINYRNVSSGEVGYRRVDSAGAARSYIYNIDGSFNSSIGTVSSTCDNQSLSQLKAAGDAFYLRDQSSSGTSGQMSYFNLNACPSGWTQQIQLDRTATSDSPMVLCRRN